MTEGSEPTVPIWLPIQISIVAGFHIPYVRNSLFEVLEYGAYTIELERYAVLQVAIAKSGESACSAPRSHPDAGKNVGAYYYYYYWLYPTAMFNVYPWASR
jgi:choline monooxygenase